MSSLENKIPPPILFVVVTLLMIWMTGGVHMDPWPLLAAAIVVWAAGIGMVAAAITQFRRAGTSPNPVDLQEASSIVSSGIYRVTRNPMYLALTILLIGVTLFLATPWALLGPLAFVLYIQRFQIEPEERVLSEKFGAEYDQYRARVRRWL